MTSWFEGVGIALSSIRANKVRAALTILGVAIGVSVVMIIGAMISGINRGVSDIFESLGPRTFFVFRAFQGGIQVSDGTGDNPWRRNPPITPEEAELLEELPSVQFVIVDDGTNTSVSFGSRTIASVSVRGRGVNWPRVSGGDLYPGRSFTNLEALANDRVAIINARLAELLFSQRDPMGRTIKIAGVPFRVIGVMTPPPDIFGGGNRPELVIPFGTFDKYIPYWRGWMNLLVLPDTSVTVQEAIDDVTATLRTARGLKPRDDNNFAVVTQDKLLENWNAVTGAFFLVMLALSSVGLMVGGIGVVAIMMISVTERTREIGVRKALGARKREIMWQFLVEAATLTLVGGMIGLVIGGLGSGLVAALSPLPASVPVMSVVAALAMSVVTGVLFGIYPAARAARLDPVEALRYE